MPPVALPESALPPAEAPLFSLQDGGLLVSTEPGAVTVCDLVARLQEEGFRRDAGMGFLRAWLTVIESEVLFDAEVLLERREAGISLARQIGAGEAVLRLRADLSPAGWEDDAVEQALGRTRRHSHVGRQMVVWSSLSREQVEAITAAVARELAAQGEGCCFEPLGRVESLAGGEFRVRLRGDYLCPQAESRRQTEPLEVIPEDEDRRVAV